MQERQKSAVCRREQRVRRHRAPTLRKPFFCRNKPRTGLFRHSHSGQRVVISPPHRSAEKMQNRSFYYRPQQGSRRNPAKRFRWEEDEQQRERVLPLAAGRGIRRPLGRQGRQPASHLSGLRRSRCPAKCTGRGMPHAPFPGGSPHPPSCERFCGNAFIRLRRRSFKGGPVPLRGTPSSPRGREKSFQKGH